MELCFLRSIFCVTMRPTFPLGQGFPTFFRRGTLFFFQSGMDPQGTDLARILN